MHFNNGIFNIRYVIFNFQLNPDKLPIKYVSLSYISSSTAGAERLVKVVASVFLKKRKLLYKQGFTAA